MVPRMDVTSKSIHLTWLDDGMKCCYKYCLCTEDRKKDFLGTEDHSFVMTPKCCSNWLHIPCFIRRCHNQKSKRFDATSIFCLCQKKFEETEIVSFVEATPVSSDKFNCPLELESDLEEKTVYKQMASKCG